jgi:ubiquinone/menaquinone biosynthesis C-methylase UbiE
MESLLDVFGGNGAYVAGCVLAGIMILIILAFRQGRAIQFWPPKIGAEPTHSRTQQLSGKSLGTTNGVAVEAPLPAPVPVKSTEGARIFDVTDAAEFYQAIAQNYDQRNSANLITTHMEVITRIEQARRVKPALRVLDLGGGTGQNVATYFFNDSNISWTYVDSCPAMISLLRQHLVERPLYERLTVYLEDINSVHLLLPADSYDIVLLNLVLSSMRQLPDFARLARLVAPGGQLIIADINPAYTEAHAYYRAMAFDGTFVAMRMNPVQPLEVASSAKCAGLQLAEMTKIGSDTISYSFIITFAKPSLLEGNGKPGIIPRAGREAYLRETVRHREARRAELVRRLLSRIPPPPASARRLFVPHRVRCSRFRSAWVAAACLGCRVRVRRSGRKRWRSPWAAGPGWLSPGLSIWRLSARFRWQGAFFVLRAGGPSGTRTLNQWVKSPLLCH